MSPRKSVKSTDKVAVLDDHRPVEDRVERENSAPDPATAFRTAAQGQALAALEVLAELMKEAKSEAVRASAANSVIDRAHGRAAQAVRVGASGGEDGEGVELRFTWQCPEKS